MFWRVWVTIFALLISAGAWAAEQDVLEQEQAIWRRISTIAEQRELTQRIEQATCYVLTGYEADTYSEIAKDAADQFDRNLAALMAGDDGLNLTAETEPAAIRALRNLNDTWQRFSPAARQVMSGDVHAVPVRHIISLDKPLLSLSEISTKVIRAVYTEKLVARKSMTSTIDVAMRQRMLALRLAKSFCYIASNLHRNLMINDMISTMEQFETALGAMELGDYDMEVVDPPNLAVMSALMDVRSAWTDIQPHLTAILENPDENSRDLAFVAMQSETLKDLSEKVVELYMK